VVKTKSAEETIELGKKLGSSLKPNTIIALSGQLGAGKTTLVQGIAKGLKVKDYVNSPSFIIINEHQGRLPLFHVDLYRLDSVEDLGIEEYYERGGVCVIEWAEKLGKDAPQNMEKIAIKVLSENEREICVSSALAVRLK